jgi:hypothetical protein
MSPKSIFFAISVLALLAAPTNGEESKPPVAAKAQPAASTTSKQGDHATAVAHRVFEGSQFWWKHRSTVADPTRNSGLIAQIGQMIEDVVHFIVKILGRIARYVGGLLPDWIAREGAPIGIGRGLLWALVALGIAVIGWMAYRVFRQRRLAAGSLSIEPLQEPERLPDALILMARAKAALEAGDTFEALRLGFLAILAGLEDRGIVRYDAARTNSEYLRDLRRQPELAADFRQVALPVDRALYGKIQPQPGDVERALQFCQGLMAAAPVGST